MAWNLLIYVQISSISSISSTSSKEKHLETISCGTNSSARTSHLFSDSTPTIFPSFYGFVLVLSKLIRLQYVCMSGLFKTFEFEFYIIKLPMNERLFLKSSLDFTLLRSD